ncbi:Adhesin YadA precursor [Serratia ficaria]|nr:Adhesin YadA precursor [Serratia ficaria]
MATTDTTLNGTQYIFAGTTPSSTVSVGDVGAERTITNVAAGRISASSTDAINGSQLFATNQAVGSLNDGAVKYDRNPDGSVNRNRVTLNPGGTPTSLSNVAAGEVAADSSDAVNGAQLYDTNQQVTQLGDTLTHIAGDTSQANTDANGLGLRYARTNEAGLEQKDAYAKSAGSTAVGYNAQATADDALALGRDAAASHAGSVALGANARADGSTLGSAAYNPGNGQLAGTAPVGEVSLGSEGAERRLTHVAAGAEDTDAVNVSQLKAVDGRVADLNDGAVKYDRNPDGSVNRNRVTLNPGGTPTSLSNVAAGEVAADSSDAVNGAQLYDTNQQVTQLGDTLTHIAGDTSQANTDANGLGLRYARTNEAGLEQKDAYAKSAGSTAVGYNAQATADDALALGRDAAASHAGSVALGNGARTDAAIGTAGTTLNGNNYQFAGAAPIGTVSIGVLGGERTITHVAAGRISETSTDAINGSQLYVTNQALNNLGNELTNIKQGGAGVKYFHANGGNAAALPDSQANGLGSTAMGPRAVASGDSSVAVGNGAIAKQEGDVALGAGSVADAGADSYKGKYSDAQNDTAGTVSVGSPGAERTVSNVADGKNATDAVNLRQLDGAVKESKDYTDQRIKDVNSSITEVGDSINNLDKRVTQVEGDVTDIQNGNSGMFQVKQGQDAPIAPKASGDNAVAGGSGAIASGKDSAAIGNDSLASGNNATALGNGSKATGNNAVALGAGSEASRDNSVSVGAVGNERQVTNVARGTSGTDAVNVDQLHDVENGFTRQIAGVRNDIQHLDNRLSAGVAAAMAMSSLPQPYQAGASMFSMGGASWSGESGVAMGVSAISENGKWVLKGAASSSSRGDVGAGVGVGYQW